MTRLAMLAGLAATFATAAWCSDTVTVGVNGDVPPYVDLVAASQLLEIDPVTADMIIDGRLRVAHTVDGDLPFQVITNFPVVVSLPTRMYVYGPGNQAQRAAIAVQRVNNTWNITTSGSTQYVWINGEGTWEFSVNASIRQYWTEARNAGTYTGSFTIDVQSQ